MGLAAGLLTIRPRPGQSGFTLLELGVVLTLLALFSLLTIPLFGGTRANKLAYSARCLNGTIKYLFNEAALTGREHRLICNLDRGTYSARILDADGEVVTLSGIGRETELAGDVRFRDLQLPDRGTVTTGEVTVRIHPAGWVEETSVHLEDGRGNALTLHVMPLTGTAEIFEGYKTL